MRRITSLALTALVLGFSAGAATAQDASQDSGQGVSQDEIEANLDGLNVLYSFSEFGEPLYPDDFEHFDYVNPDAPTGGAITLGAFGTYERLDTIVVGGQWAAGIGLVGDALFTGSGDELSSYYPLIAEHVAVPDDIGHAVFTIREEARFQDGHPITAEDFVYAYNLIKDHGRPLLQGFWADVIGAEALNDRQVRFDFATTNNMRTLGLAASFGPEPVHHYQANDIDPTEPRLDPVVSDGPYRIAELDAGRAITYERVEDYWAADLPVNVGQNNFDEIRYIYFRDMDVMFEAFLAGELDFWSENRAQRWAEQYDAAAVERGDIVMDDTIPDNQPRGYIGFVFNTRRAIFEDERVREAFGYLWDFEWANRNIFFEQYRRVSSYFPGSDYGTEAYPLPTDAELPILEMLRDDIRPDIYDSIMNEPFTVPQTDGSGRIREQLRTATALLAEAGWQVQDGVLTNAETGAPFEMEILLGSPALERVMLPYIENLSRAGIDANLRVVDTAQYRRLTDDFDYDMIYIGANFFPPPGSELRTYFDSEAVDEQASANWPGIALPAVDRLLDMIANEREDEARLEAMTRVLDRILVRHHFIIPSYILDRYRLAYWNIFDMPAQPPYFGTGFPGSWWYDEDAAASISTR